MCQTLCKSFIFKSDLILSITQCVEDTIILGLPRRKLKLS